jgi:hypothetical protein
MKGASAVQVERARRLLAIEGGGGASAEESVAAAGRVYEKLAARLAPLLGAAGVQALFVRSAKLARDERAFLGGLAPAIEGATGGPAGLGAYLRTLEPPAAAEAAALLFGTFLDLIITFIGDRLTVQVLQGAWPAIDDTAPRENPK